MITRRIRRWTSITVTDNDNRLFGDSTRRSFLNKAGIATGAIALSGDGVAAQDGTTTTQDGGGSDGKCTLSGVIGSTNTDYDYESINLNEADVEFIHTMVSHHWGALVLAFLVPERSDREPLVELSQTIIDAQYAQIQMMQQMLMDTGVDHIVDQVPPDTAIPEMPTNGAMAALRTLKGERFNAAWINIMSAHHRGGMILARRVLEEGEAEPLQDLARKMIRAQERQIYNMYQYYVEWMEPPSEEPLPTEVGEEDDEDTEDP